MSFSLVKATRMVQAIRRAGGDARFTLYKDAAHDSWTPALKEAQPASLAFLKSEVEEKNL